MTRTVLESGNTSRPLARFPVSLQTFPEATSADASQESVLKGGVKVGDVLVQRRSEAMSPPLAEGLMSNNVSKILLSDRSVHTINHLENQ